MDVKNFVSAFGWEIPIYMQRIATKLSKEFLLSNTQRPWCLVANCSHRLYYPRVFFAAYKITQFKRVEHAFLCWCHHSDEQLPANFCAIIDKIAITFIRDGNIYMQTI